MRLTLLTMLCLLTGGCGLRPIVGIYTTDTPTQAVRAWSDAYNAGQYRQLMLLVHPSQRDRFEDRASQVKKRLKTWRINSFKLGGEITVKRSLTGRVVTLVYHDGRRPNVKEGILVKAKGRWWVWSY